LPPVPGILANIFTVIRSFFSADAGVAERAWYRTYLEVFIILALIAVGTAMIYVIVAPPGTPLYP